MEWILGFRLRGTTMSIDPCIPRAWPNYSIFFRYHSASYRIKVENPQSVSRGIARVELDGKPLPNSSNIPIVDDGVEHRVLVVLG
jgi:cyclic beta-1,2-glucan synthetase